MTVLFAANVGVSVETGLLKSAFFETIIVIELTVILEAAPWVMSILLIFLSIIDS